MSEITNNSLSDLNNRGIKFNRLLSESEITNSVAINQENKEQLQADIKKLQTQYQNSADSTQKALIQSQIDKKQSTLNSLDTVLSTDNTTFSNIDGNGKTVPTSLFDRDAYIDYAKFIKSDGTIYSNWKEYNNISTNQNTNTNNGTTQEEKYKKFTVNNSAPINEAVTLIDNSLLNSNNFSSDGLSIPNIIAWSEKYPALQLRFQDFVYCKRLGYYPNNRLIVLRRFKGGVPDNLFDYYNTSSKAQFSQPLATMITWLKPDEDIIDMSFNENWEDYDAGLLQTFKSAISSFSSKDKDKNGNLIKNVVELSEGTDDLLTTLAIQKLVGNDSSLSREDGVPFTRNMSGNPNLIRHAQKRVTGGKGLHSKIEFKVKFEYELRYVNNIDPGIAMMDLISNAMRMGTSESEFRFNIPYLKDNTAIKSLIHGDISKFTDAFKSTLKDMVSKIQKMLSDDFNNLVNSVSSPNDILNATLNIIDGAFTYIISRYREDLKAALSVDTGLPSGIWHMTIGNPKNPIISCGDLIITNSTLKLGNEMGYNDFPNSFEIEYELESARERGRESLIRIMNSGRGRLYVYPDSSKNPDYDLY